MAPKEPDKLTDEGQSGLDLSNKINKDTAPEVFLEKKIDAASKEKVAVTSEKKLVAANNSDFESISEERKKQIRAQAINQVNEEKQKKAEELYLLQELSIARGETTKIHDAWLDANEVITVGLPPLCGGMSVSIDNIHYMNGMTYTVTRSKAMVIKEIIDKVWRHEDIALRGKDENAYRMKRNERYSTRTLQQVVNTTQTLKA